MRRAVAILRTLLTMPWSIVTGIVLGILTIAFDAKRFVPDLPGWLLAVIGIVIIELTYARWYKSTHPDWQRKGYNPTVRALLILNLLLLLIVLATVALSFVFYVPR